MKKIVLFVILGVAAGYVLGTRTGREKYESLVGRVTGFAKDTAGKTTAAVGDARERTVTAATSVASRVGEARDNALEDFDDDLTD
jgi:uncharacterized protein YjbJ (UPF0337 family)